jgi:hypothetical protein
VDKVTSLPIYAKPLLPKVIAVLCLVLVVSLLIFKQLVRTVSKLASILVGTVSKLDKLFAEFGFLLVFLGINKSIRGRTHFRRVGPLVSAICQLDDLGSISTLHPSSECHKYEIFYIIARLTLYLDLPLLTAVKEVRVDIIRLQELGLIGLHLPDYICESI